MLSNRPLPLLALSSGLAFGCTGEDPDPSSDTESVESSATSAATGASSSRPDDASSSTGSASSGTSTTNGDTPPDAEDSSTGEPEATGSSSGDTGELDEACTPQTCAHLEGALAGVYTHRAVEQAGNLIANEVTCEGGVSVFVDFSQTPPLQAAASCSYAGSLGGFEPDQSAEVTATVWPDGRVEGTVEHAYAVDLVRTYAVHGTLDDSGIALTIEGSFLPHPMSAVPWTVTGSLSGE